jgi:hypothetical protein
LLLTLSVVPQLTTDDLVTGREVEVAVMRGVKVMSRWGIAGANWRGKGAVVQHEAAWEEQ